MYPSDEPTAYAGAITALAVALIPFLRAFGVNITKDQGDACMVLLAAVIGFGTLILRSKVTPYKDSVSRTSAEAAIDKAMLSDITDPKPTV